MDFERGVQFSPLDWTPVFFFFRNVRCTTMWGVVTYIKTMVFVVVKPGTCTGH